MKLFVMCCVVLSLAVCSVEQAEGYDTGRTGCVSDCDELYDLCTSSTSTVPYKDCVDAHLKRSGGC